MSEEITKVGMKPSHPGEFIREEILAELGLSVARAAEILGVRRATLSDLVKLPCRPVSGNGLADREGFRGQHGHAATDAGVVRQLHDAAAGRRNRREAVHPAWAAMSDGGPVER